MDRILVCLAIDNSPFASRIRQALEQAGQWDLCSATTKGANGEIPLSCPEVVVIDHDTFDRMPLPLNRPERVVLVARKSHSQLDRVWEAGIISVVWETDRIETIFLAIQAAALRCRTPEPAMPKSTFLRLN
jgi:hypothetical protein